MKTIPSSQHIYAFAPSLQPVDQAELGDVVRFETMDALSGQVRSEKDILSELDFDCINPATGPIEIAGTRPGDTLVVHIQAIELAHQGAIVTGPGMPRCSSTTLH